VEARAVAQIDDRQVEGLGEVDKADDLVARVGGPAPAIEERVARHHRHGQAVDAGEPGDDRAAEHFAHFEERAPVDHGFDDRAHLVDPAALARDHLKEELLAPFGVVGRLAARRDLVNRWREVREKTPGGGKGFLLAVGRMVDGAAAGLDFPAAQFEPVELLLAERVDHRGPGDEEGGGILGHHRIMARGHARRAKPGD
jgi:hypothetical protein